MAMSSRRNQPGRSKPKLDFARLIDDCGGPTALTELLAAQGMRVRMKTVSQWGSRNRASGDGVLMLLSLAKSKGMDLGTYLI